MDLNKKDSSALEPLDEILRTLPKAGSGELISTLQKIQETFTSGELKI